MLSVINRHDSPRETNSLLLGLYSLLMAESRLQYRVCPAAFCLFWPTADDMFPHAYVETYEREHTGCSGKIVFFLNSLQPQTPAVRDLQSSKHNASVQSLLLAGNFLYNQ